MLEGVLAHALGLMHHGSAIQIRKLKDHMNEYNIHTFRTVSISYNHNYRSYHWLLRCINWQPDARRNEISILMCLSVDTISHLIFTFFFSFHPRKRICFPLVPEPAVCRPAVAKIHSFTDNFGVVRNISTVVECGCLSG